MARVFKQARVTLAFLAVAIACVSVLALVGCGNSRDSRFVGVWKGEAPITDNDGLTYNAQMTLQIGKDGNFQLQADVKGRWFGFDYGSGTVTGSWESSSDKVRLKESTSDTYYEFQLMEDGKSLVDIHGPSAVLYRVK